MNHDLTPFLQSIQLNNRIDYIVEVTTLSWRVYKSDKDKNDELVSNDFLLRCYGNRLACISYAYCSEKSPWKVTPFDVRVHLNWYLELNESFTDDNSVQVRELETMFSTSSLFKKLDLRDAVDSLPLNTFMARLMRSQWDNRKATLRGVERRYSIFKRWMVNTKHFELAHKVRKRIQIHSGMELEELVRNAFVVFTSALNFNPAGIVVPFPDNIFDELADYGISRNHFDTILKKWSWSHSALKTDMNIQFRESQRIDYKYFPSPLIKFPVFDISESLSSPTWLIPNPWDFVTKISHSCSDLFSDILDPQDIGSFFGELGEEYAKWMKEFSIEKYGEAKVIDLDIYRDTKSKIADIILFQDDTAIIVEFKRSLGTYADKAYLDPQSTVKLLEEVHEGFLQIEATKHLIAQGKIIGLEKVTKFAHVICCDQTIVQEDTIYLDFYLRSELRDIIKIEPLALFDTDDYEKYISHFSVPEFFERIKIATNNMIDKPKATKDAFKCEEKDFESNMYNKAKLELMPWFNRFQKGVED